mgnify:CR=1 FL=1
MKIKRMGDLSTGTILSMIVTVFRLNSEYQVSLPSVCEMPNLKSILQSGKFPRFKWISLFSFLVFVVFPNTEAFSETLQNSVESALLYNPQVENASAGYFAAEEGINEARAGLYPDVEVNVQGGRFYADTTTTRAQTVSRGAAYSGLFEASLTVRQPLFDGMETFRRMDAAQARAGSADLSIENVRESLAIEVVRSYIDVLRTRKTLEMLESQKTEMQDFKNRIERSVNQAAASESELLQAEEIMLQLQNIETGLIRDLRSAEARFAELTGYFPPENLVQPERKTNLVPEDLQDAILYARQNHPEIKALKLEALAADHDVKAEKGTFLPDINTELTYLERDQSDTVGGETLDARALLKASWTFNVGGRVKARARRAEFAHKQALASTRQTIRRIEREIREAFSIVKSAQRQQDILLQTADKKKRLLETFRSQFEGGNVTLVQLMQATNQMFKSRRDLMAVEYQLMQAEYFVIGRTGRLRDALYNVAVLDDGKPEKMKGAPE